MAAERIREGEPESAVIDSYVFNCCAIYRWLKTANGRGKIIKALAAHNGTAPPQAHIGTRTAGISLNQQQEPDAMRI